MGSVPTGPAAQAPDGAADARREPGPLERVGQDLGIPALGEAPWGSHFCQFFGGRQDLLDFLVPFYRTGLERNEACLLTTTDPLDVDDAVEVLSREIDGFGAAVDRGQMVVVSAQARYLAGGSFDPERILELVPAGVEEALRRGYSGRRACTNENWMQQADWDPMMTLEGRLSRTLSGRRSISMCAYPLPKCDAGQLLDVLMRHQFALIRHDDWTLIEPSERKRATEAVERMNVALAQRTAELQSALADLRGFSRWVTHDLRAPLASITSFGEMLAHSSAGRLSDDEAGMLERMRNGAARMERLITDILTYSTAQHADLQIRALDLRSMVAEAWSAVGGENARASLRVYDLPLARGDAALVRQALIALLDNAIRFSAGRPDPLVEAGARTLPDGELAYYVRDNGVGFERADADALFGAFTRLHSVTSSEGAGLGLAIVKEVFARHGGRVWAEGEPGLGATFFFTLPTPAGAGQIPRQNRRGDR